MQSRSALIGGVDRRFSAVAETGEQRPTINGTLACKSPGCVLHYNCQVVNARLQQMVWSGDEPVPSAAPARVRPAHATRWLSMLPE
jgi:hypothetical protein